MEASKSSRIIASNILKRNRTAIENVRVEPRGKDNCSVSSFSRILKKYRNMMVFTDKYNINIIRFG